MNVIESQVDAYIKPYLEVGGFSGSIFIAYKNQILLSKGYGMANIELGVRNRPQTKFHIASLSKTFTSAAIMMLEEKGKLSVRDRLIKFIPDFPNGDSITVHHLLTHTSGISDVNQLPDYDVKSRYHHTTANLVQIIKDMIRERGLESKPGQEYSYSNSNYNILAYLIEKLSGVSYGEFLNTNIFIPLGMTNTAHDSSSASILMKRASGYVPSGADRIENAPFIDWTIKTGNGSLYSTVEDLYKWSKALDHESLLQKSSLAQIFTPHNDGSIGYGWFLGKRHKREVQRMSGRSPGFGGEIQRYPLDGLYIIVLSNNYAPTPSIIATDLAAIALGEPYNIPTIQKPVQPKKEVLDSYVGSYNGGNNFFRTGTVIDVIRQDNHLIMKWSTGAIVELIAQSDSTFFDRMFWATVSFLRRTETQPPQLIWNYGGTGHVAERLIK